MSKYRIKIEHDEDAQNPRTEFDQQTTFAFFHRRYRLGDANHGLREDNFSGWEAMEDYIVKEFKPVYITAVYMYDHSGITIKSSPFSCPWDSGRIGFAWITRKQLAECVRFKHLTKKLKERAETIVESDIKVYDQYLSGDVWCCTVEKQSEEDPAEWETEDSCVGFYGHDWKTNGMADYLQKFIDDGAEIVEGT
jgi:hypothetical protein